MIYIGLTGWGDHDSIYPPNISSGNKLKEYAAHFPIVEVDSTFYAIQPERNIQKWVQDTPKSFQFVVKAYQAMTGHTRENHPFSNKEEMFASFKQMLKPIIEANKLAMVLFQFPPWFDCRKENVEYLRFCKAHMGDIPCALEFRHQSWFYPKYRSKTISFMKEGQWIHSICDEPQAGEGSVPTILECTDKGKTLIRFHGRNVHGWVKPKEGNWRDVRYLYRYNKEELLEWKNHVTNLKNQTEHIYILFNNNSGGDAADNAKQMIELLDITYEGLAPKQLDLFDFE